MHLSRKNTLVEFVLMFYLLYSHGYFYGGESIVQSENIKHTHKKIQFITSKRFIAYPWFGNAIEK